MATYPSYTISLDSTPQKEQGIEDDFSQSGIQHSREYHSQQYYRFDFIHPSMTQSEVDTLDAFYTAGKRDEHTFTYYDTSPITTYTVKFLAPPEIVENYGLGRFAVNVKLRGYKN